MCIRDSVEVPASVSTLTENHFKVMRSLESITVAEEHESYQTVDGVLFSREMDQLISYPRAKPDESYVMPETVLSMGKDAFYRNAYLESITLSSGLGFDSEIAPAQHFYTCPSLASISVPDTHESYESLDGVLFSKGLDELIYYPLAKPGDNYTMPTAVTTLAKRAFSNNIYLRDIVFSPNVELIPSYCFAVSGFERFVVPETITRINSYAFIKCEALESLQISSSVLSMSNSIFRACNSLTGLEVSSDNPNYSTLDGVLFNKDQTVLIGYPAGLTATHYTLPETVVELHNSSFVVLDHLESVTLPEGLEIIGPWSFCVCDRLTAIRIPASVTQLGYNSFNSSDSLRDVMFEGAKPTIVGGSDVVFKIWGKTVTGYVKPEHVESYGGYGTMWGSVQITAPTTYEQTMMEEDLFGEDLAVDSDPEERGVDNGVAYALGMKPKGRLSHRERRRLPRLERATTGEMEFTFNLPDELPDGVSYCICASDNIGDSATWSEVARMESGVGSWSGTASIEESVVDGERCIKARRSSVNQTKSFMRLETVITE